MSNGVREDEIFLKVNASSKVLEIVKYILKSAFVVTSNFKSLKFMFRFD
jgi:hypothetical protein